MSDEENNAPVVKKEDLDVSPAAVLLAVQREGLNSFLNDNDMSKARIQVMGVLSRNALTEMRLDSDNKNAADDREVAIALTEAIEGLGYEPGLKVDAPERELPDIELGEFSEVLDESKQELENLDKNTIEAIVDQQD